MAKAEKKLLKKTKAEIKASIAAHAKAWGVSLAEAKDKLLEIGVGRRATLDDAALKEAKKRKGKKAKPAKAKPAKGEAKAKPRSKSAKSARARGKATRKAAPRKAEAKQASPRKSLSADQKAAKLAKDRARRASKKTTNGASLQDAQDTANRLIANLAEHAGD